MFFRRRQFFVSSAGARNYLKPTLGPLVGNPIRRGAYVASALISRSWRIASSTTRRPSVTFSAAILTEGRRTSGSGLASPVRTPEGRTMWKFAALVFFGGAAGAVLRELFMLLTPRLADSFPLDILAANLLALLPARCRHGPRPPARRIRGNELTSWHRRRRRTIDVLERRLWHGRAHVRFGSERWRCRRLRPDQPALGPPRRRLWCAGCRALPPLKTGRVTCD
jgi:hypothetical protein